MDKGISVAYSLSRPSYSQESNRDQHNNTYIGYSNPFFIQSSKKERQENMSLVYVLFNDEEIFLAADSRSTSKIDSRVHYDNYKKIALLKPSNKIIAATGDNDFNGKNLTELVSECRDEQELKERLLPYATTLNVFSTEHGKIYKETISFCDGTYTVEKICVLGRKGTASFSSSSYVTSFLKPIPVAKKYCDETAIGYINSIFNLCINVPEISDCTIGGDIHILKITSQGFTWLQNGYEL